MKKEHSCALIMAFPSPLELHKKPLNSDYRTEQYSIGQKELCLCIFIRLQEHNPKRFDSLHIYTYLLEYTIRSVISRFDTCEASSSVTHIYIYIPIYKYKHTYTYKYLDEEASHVSAHMFVHNVCVYNICSRLEKFHNICLILCYI